MRHCPACGRRLEDAFDRCIEDGTALEPDATLPALAPGTTLELGVAVERLIGAGPTGELYAAAGPEGLVAVKLVSEALAADRSYRSRLTRVVERVSGVEHPGVAAVLGQGEWNGRPYIIRELVRGRSAMAVVAAGGPLAPDRALKVAVRIADALAEAHRRGALHLVLRPSNVFLLRDDSVKLVDFGLGARVELGERVLYGDLRYLAPEQLDGKLVSFRSDIYGLGALLFFLVTGRHLFEGTAEELARALASKPAPRPSSLVPTLAGHQEIDSIVARALEKTPSKRYLSVQHFARAMDALAQARPAEAAAGGPVPRPGGFRAMSSGTLEMGAVGRRPAAPAAPPSPERQATLRSGQPHALVHDTVEMPPPAAAPPAVHPRFERALELDDTIRMDVGPDAPDTLEMASPDLLDPDPVLEDDDGETKPVELPEWRGGDQAIADPLSPLPPVRPPRPMPRHAAPPGPTLEPGVALELAEDDDIEIVEEDPAPEPPPRGRTKKPKREAEFAVRPEAAVRLAGPARPGTRETGGPVLVDQSFLDEARGPERNRDTMEIRLPASRAATGGSAGAAPGARRRPRRIGRVVFAVLTLVVLFVLAAVGAAAVARRVAASGRNDPPQGRVAPEQGLAPRQPDSASGPPLDLLTPSTPTAEQQPAVATE